jgi:hypothetical protein
MESAALPGERVPEQFRAIKPQAWLHARYQRRGSERTVFVDVLRFVNEPTAIEAEAKWGVRMFAPEQGPLYAWYRKKNVLVLCSSFSEPGGAGGAICTELSQSSW